MGPCTSWPHPSEGRRRGPRPTAASSASASRRREARERLPCLILHAPFRQGVRTVPSGETWDGAAFAPLRRWASSPADSRSRRAPALRGRPRSVSRECATTWSLAFDGACLAPSLSAACSPGVLAGCRLTFTASARPATSTTRTPGTCSPADLTFSTRHTWASAQWPRRTARGPRCGACRGASGGPPSPTDCPRSPARVRPALG